MPFFTVTKVAELLGCSEETVELETREGRLPGLKFGRSWVYPEQALTMILTSRAVVEMVNRQPAAPQHADPSPKVRTLRAVPPVLPTSSN